MLTQELKDIILHEIEIDPMRIGYHTYIDNYRKTGNISYLYNLMSMLNGNFTKTKIVYESMHDFYTFLNAVPPEATLHNTQIIWTLLSRVPSNSVDGVVTQINDLPAEDLYKFLQAYGPEVFLYNFGNPYYTQDELQLFNEVAGNLLQYLVEKESAVEKRVVRDKCNCPSRISFLFSGIENAPNALVNVNDIIEIISGIA